jgi:hypothetical protein
MYGLKSKLEILRLFYIVSFIFLFACDKKDDDVQVSNVYNGNVYITNQTELEDFASYNYEKINGHLIISGVNSLNPLHGLNEVYTLEILDTQLISLEGLSSLNTFTGENIEDNNVKDSQIIISNNSSLNSLGGLASGILIDHLIIQNNINLYSFCALQDIEVVGLYNVDSNSYNPSMQELKNENTCDKDLYFNPNCNQDYIRKVYSGDINITSQQELIEFGNQEYTEIEGILTISGVNSLEPIERLRLIDELVIKNTELKNLNELKCIAVLNSLQLIDNPLLEHLKGLANTKISQPNVYFRDDIIEFENESGVLVISNNDTLINLEGLEKIEYLKTVLIENNDVLISFKALSNLVAISNPGRDSEYPNEDFLKIINNNALLNLEGLENMSVLHLYIHNNDALLDLTGLSKISHLEWLSIKDNKKITSLNGLNSITAVIDYYDGIKIPGYTVLLDNILLNNFCVLRDVDFDYPFTDNYQVSGNAYNPTLSQIKTDDGCSN